MWDLVYRGDYRAVCAKEKFFIHSPGGGCISWGCRAGQREKKRVWPRALNVVSVGRSTGGKVKAGSKCEQG